MTKPRIRCSFSGGRTSAFMSILLKQHLSATHDLMFIFANTGWEHPDTLRFVDEVDRRYSLGVHWVEAVVHEGRTASTHRFVDYASASRGGEPFEAVVSKYGLPNRTFQLCTRELKTNPMRSATEALGWPTGSYETAIGIRMDERRRVTKTVESRERIIYPLIDMWPNDKDDVIAFFEDFDWDLRIPEYEGNCRRCHKKSDAKLLAGYQDDPASFDFPIKLDRLYASVGPNTHPGPRRMYRGLRTPQMLVEEFQRPDFKPGRMFVRDGGCSEQCELFPTDEAAAAA